ILITFLARSHF
ncbi:T3SS secreted effector NleG-like protein, partial [Escherichia coli EC1865]